MHCVKQNEKDECMGREAIVRGLPARKRNCISGEPSGMSLSRKLTQIYLCFRKGMCSIVGGGLQGLEAGSLLVVCCIWSGEIY